MAEDKNCDCVICKHQNNVDIPIELVNEILSGNVTLFTGAGISTESKIVLKNTFYETIFAQLPSQSEDLDFPSLMEKFCRQANGRFKLLSEIKKRFDNVDSFPELKKTATRFHRELGTLFPVKNIITTNWDTYFERYCRATPFVVDSDLAFWEAAERRVLKIHGSIDNLSSIVATNEDYKQCKKRLDKGLIGSLLKTILATQTIIFIGYSLSDSDFSESYDYVKVQMDQLHKQAYIITPFENEAEKFRNLGLIPIITDGAFFISQIKQHGVIHHGFLPDSVFDDIQDFLVDIYHEHECLHERIKITEFPQVIHNASYQDGLIHALERTLEMRYSGSYSHMSRIIGIIDLYEKIKKEYLQNKSYNTVAYIDGYLNGLSFLLIDEENREEYSVPLYFAFGSKDGFFTYEEFEEFIKNKPEVHKASLKNAKKILASVNNPESIVFHHPPWL